MTRHKLIIFTKDKSLDTWVTRLQEKLDDFSCGFSFGPAKTVINQNKIIMFYSTQSLEMSIELDLDSRDNILEKYGYEGVSITSCSTNRNQIDLMYIYGKLEDSFHILIEEPLCTC